MFKIFLLSYFIGSLILISPSVSQEAILGLHINEIDQYVFYEQLFNLSVDDCLTLRPYYFMNSEKPANLDISYIKRIDKINFLIALQFLANSSDSMTGRMGIRTPLFHEVELESGLMRTESTFAAYTSLSFFVENNRLSIEWKNRPGIEYAYIFRDHQVEKITDYIQFLSPQPYTSTMERRVLIKGFYYDHGVISVNQQKIPIRSDGLFIIDMPLPTYGPNQLTISFKGKSISLFEQLFIINRLLPFRDIQKLPKPVIDFIQWFNYPDGYYFYPEEVITREELFYCIYRLLDMTKTDNSGVKFTLGASEINDTLFQQELISSANIEKNKNIISVAEGLALLARLLPSCDSLTELDLDIPENHWLRLSLVKLAQCKIVASSINREFLGQPLTRIQLYNYLERLYQLIKR